MNYNEAIKTFKLNYTKLELNKTAKLLSSNLEVGDYWYSVFKRDNFGIYLACHDTKLGDYLLLYCHHIDGWSVVLSGEYIRIPNEHTDRDEWFNFSMQYSPYSNLDIDGLAIILNASYQQLIDGVVSSWRT